VFNDDEEKADNYSEYNCEESTFITGPSETPVHLQRLPSPKSMMISMDEEYFSIEKPQATVKRRLSRADLNLDTETLDEEAQEPLYKTTSCILIVVVIILVVAFWH
tara:strand:- start:143 stop:460 length:318 start_codon:yes stop_codon:yes gene_type:complete